MSSKRTVPDSGPSRILPRLVSKMNLSKIHSQDEISKFSSFLDIVKFLFSKQMESPDRKERFFLKLAIFDLQ